MVLGEQCWRGGEEMALSGTERFELHKHIHVGYRFCVQAAPTMLPRGSLRPWFVQAHRGQPALRRTHTAHQPLRTLG